MAPALDPNGRLGDTFREELHVALDAREVAIVNEVIATWDEEDATGPLDAALADLENRVRKALGVKGAR